MKLRHLAAIGLAGTLGLAACGSSSKDSGSAGTTAAPSPETNEDASFDAGAPPERVIELQVELVEALGAELLVHSAIDAATVQEGTSFDDPDEAPGSAMLVARLTPRSRIEPGDTVKLTVDTRQLHLFDPVSGLSLADAGPPPPA